MDSERHPSAAKASTPKRVTYALAGAGLAIMALPLVTAVLPGEAGATRVPSQAGTTSIGVTTVVPTDPTVVRSTLAPLAGTTFQNFGPGLTTYTVSSNICTVEVIVSGAAGGNISGSVAGRGASIRGQFAVAAGAKFDINVGAYRGGGAGGLADLNGGGATRIVNQSSGALIVEAAGGGGDALALITNTNASSNTIPSATTLPGGTVPPFIKVNVVAGKGADAPGTTAVSPVTATVQVPVGGPTPAVTTSLVPKGASAAANGAASDAATGILSKEISTGTTQFVASVRVDTYGGGAGGGGGVSKGGADADGGSAGTIFYNAGGEGSTGGAIEPYSAPYAVGAAGGGSGGLNTIGNGFLKQADGVNDQKDGKVVLREITCSTSGSTLPPLGGGRGASGPLVPAALALVGAGIGLLVMRRRSALPVSES